MKRQKKRTLNELKEFMFNGDLITVDDWNNRRNEARKEFSEKLISELDTTGFIKKLHLIHTPSWTLN